MKEIFAVRSAAYIWSWPFICKMVRFSGSQPGAQPGEGAKKKSEFSEPQTLETLQTTGLLRKSSIQSEQKIELELRFENSKSQQ